MDYTERGQGRVLGFCTAARQCGRHIQGGTRRGGGREQARQEELSDTWSRKVGIDAVKKLWSM
eukprot:758018-Hanusia_phi.AAC.7